MSKLLETRLPLASGGFGDDVDIDTFNRLVRVLELNLGAIDITIQGIIGAPTFSWTGPNGFSDTLEDISGLSTGLYVLELTSPDGCLVSYTYDVLSNSVSLSETHSNPTCSGFLDGSIVLC